MSGKTVSRRKPSLRVRLRRAGIWRLKLTPGAASGSSTRNRRLGSVSSGDVGIEVGAGGTQAPPLREGAVI
jgi:hypothetical protein